MSDDLKAAADRALEEALKTSGAKDPRDFHRQTLRYLREANPEGYEEAVNHYRDVLVPSVASGKADPLRAWRDYGRRIAELTSPGRTVEIDGTGRSFPCSEDPPLDRLVLHLPEGKGSRRAILVSVPPDLSPAQKASVDLLVSGKQRPQD